MGNKANEERVERGTNAASKPFSQPTRIILYPAIWVYTRLTGGNSLMSSVPKRIKRMGLDESKTTHAISLLVKLQPAIKWDDKRAAANVCHRFLNGIEEGSLALAKEFNEEPEWGNLHNRVLDLVTVGYLEQLDNSDNQLKEG